MISRVTHKQKPHTATTVILHPLLCAFLNKKTPMPTEAPIPIHCQRPLTAHTGPVHFVKYNISGQYCLSGGSDRTIRLWNPSTGTLIKTYSGHGWEVLGICVSADNSKFSSCGGDKSVFLWDVSTGRTIRRFTGHYQRVNCVDFNADASTIVSGSFDATVRLWDCRANSVKPIQILEDAKDSVTSLHVSKYEILTGSTDGYIRNYDVRMGRLQTDLIGQPVTSVRFNGDGNCVLVSSLDGVVRLMDKENGGLLNDFRGHKNTEYKVQSCLSNTDTHVLSGSEDGRVWVWDLVEGDLLTTIHAHTGVVSSIDYHPSDVAAVTASVDGTVKVWGTSEVTGLTQE